MRVHLRAVTAAAFVLALLSAPLDGESQQPVKSARLGVLLYSTPQGDPNVAAFRERLRELGHVEGKNLSIEYRYAEGKPERLPDLAADLVRLRPDVIATFGGEVTAAAQQATRTIPIVMLTSNDPVRSGLVASLGHPGGNITGSTLIFDELAGKSLDLLKEVMPRMTRVSVLWNPTHADPEYVAIQRAGDVLGIQLQFLEVRHAADFDSAFQAATKARTEAIIVVMSRLMALHRQRILDFVAQNRLPLVAGWGPWASAGGLMSYGPNLNDMARRNAAYVDRILRGAKPGDLPIEQPTRFELAINVKTAKALGLTVPSSVLVQADRVVQ